MTAPIRTHAITGLKIFNTRAAKATDKIAGKGYSVVDDEALKVLPAAARRARCSTPRSRRSTASSRRLAGAPPTTWRWRASSARYLEDVYSAPPVEREPLTDECDILVVGAGFAGLLLWYKLREAGFVDVRFCEKGGDVGGTWYWNRYPGIACDVESYSYLPLLEEMGYFPTMKFASGFEILEYCQKMAEKFGFYDHCLFHTTVEKTEWDEATGRWTVYTDRGDAMRARFVILANGILTSPKLARIEGMETLQGRVVPHLALGLQRRPRRASASASSAPARPPCRRSPSWPRSSRSSTCSSARRRRSTCATSARPSRRRSTTWSKRAGLGARPGAARFAKISAGPHGDPGQRRLPRRQGRRLQGAQAARARAVARGADRRSSSTRTSGSWSRSAPGSTPSSRTRRPPRRSSRTTPTAASGRRSTTSTCRRSTCRTCTLVDTAPHRRQPDQRARRRARRHGVPARRADLRDRLPVDGDVDVQHDRRPRRPHAAARSGRREGTQDVPRPAQPRLPEPVHRAPARRAAAAASTSPTPSTPTPTTSCGCCRRMRERGADVVDVKQEPEDAYAEHCREADISDRAAARLPLVLQRPRRGGARQPRLLRRAGQVARAARRRRRRRWSRMCSRRGGLGCTLSFSLLPRAQRVAGRGRGWGERRSRPRLSRPPTRLEFASLIRATLPATRFASGRRVKRARGNGFGLREDKIICTEQRQVRLLDLDGVARLQRDDDARADLRHLQVR